MTLYCKLLLSSKYPYLSTIGNIVITILDLELGVCQYPKVILTIKRNVMSTAGKWQFCMLPLPIFIFFQVY